LKGAAQRSALWVQSCLQTAETTSHAVPLSQSLLLVHALSACAGDFADSAEPASEWAGHAFVHESLPPPPPQALSHSDAANSAAAETTAQEREAVSVRRLGVIGPVLVAMSIIR
jgi:hypothetical protein